MNISPLKTILLILPFMLSACGESSTQAPDKQADSTYIDTLRHEADEFARAIGLAHGDKSWDEQQAVSGDILVVFNGSERLRGHMIAESSVGRVRMDLNDGTRMVWDGDKAWISPDTSSRQGTRFHLRTWPYFLAAPMKLDDEGTLWQDMKDGEIAGKIYQRKKLTFEGGTGDSPDDWYVVYKDPDSDKLKAMAYIVTYGNTVEKASEEPHIIVYDDYQEVDGTMLSGTWKFYNWSEENGIEGDSIGYVTLSNLAFTTVHDSLFIKPDHAREDIMPSGGE